jgi:hypothetical protein
MICIASLLSAKRRADLIRRRRVSDLQLALELGLDLIMSPSCTRNKGATQMKRSRRSRIVVTPADVTSVRGPALCAPQPTVVPREFLVYGRTPRAERAAIA